MEAKQQIAFQVPADLAKRIDVEAERLRREQPGLRVTRSEVIRLVLERALPKDGAIK